ncbi:phage portal protein [Sphingomonas sp. CROZ-RG-20F-R02-07]|uniref:phage portal protein n=1 Tax=Sphingomonas sp. CROZ-RG-20F-R02-07 TaxID=2914832 RepID=UPI001F5828A5|nr:phage portal protein [Sphingomonas sp. CROZ-RG-20F-R02-07]
MKIFGWKTPRDGARPALSTSGGAGGSWATAGGWPQSYEAQLREGYGRNPIARRAVRLVADAVADAPLVASDPALAALVTARSGGQALMGDVAAHLLLHGNAYIQVLNDAEGRVAELYALRPERVVVEPDAGGWPAAYRYAVGANVVRLNAGPERPQVIHLRSFNPLDDHYGLGCLGAAAAGIAVHNAAARWNAALLDNAARPSGALVYDPGDGSALSPDQFARLKAEMEAGFSGAANAGRPMLLEGGLKWQALSLSPADMDFAGTKAAAARDIALAFGVPPMLLGLPGDSTYANYKEANRALWRLSVLPLAGTILTGIAQGLRGWFAGAALSVDLDQVPVLADDRQRLWASIGAATFLTDAEKRQRLGVA